MNEIEQTNSTRDKVKNSKKLLERSKQVSYKESRIRLMIYFRVTEGNVISFLSLEEKKVQ